MINTPKSIEITFTNTNMIRAKIAIANSNMIIPNILFNK